MKKLVFTVALWSLGLLGGCAKGGSGPCAVNCPEIDVTGSTGTFTNLSVVGVSLPLTFTATIRNATQGPVNWNITGTNCTNPTDSSNPCGYFTATAGSTASYQGPSSVPSTPQFDVVATLQSDPGLSGSLAVTIVPDTANVNPATPNVGAGLTQQYVATAAPDFAPQTFTWTCAVNGSACANFSQDPDISGLAYYKPTAGEECGGSSCATISAAASIDPTGCSYDTKKFPCQQSETTVVSQRLSGVYAFQFSGYDDNGKALAVAGTFTVAAGGSISGTEDESAWSGSAFVTTQHAISGGSYTPLSGGNVNSNNAGVLSLNTGVFPSSYQVVLDGDGNVQMIATGSGGSGSGFAAVSSVNKFNQGTKAVYAFGLTGVDASNNRVGYAGLLPTDGVSSVSGGLIDANDNGSAITSVCGSAPCSVAGSYTFNSGTNRGQLTLTAPKAMTFDFFVANGNSSNPNNPLNLYAIATDSNPAVVGTMTLQDSKVTTYNNAAFNGTSVSALAGANDNVALILGTTFGDSSSSGVAGACPGSNLGSFAGNFDQNNAGTILSVPEFPSAAQTTNPYTYVSTNGNTGRYIFCLLGNPGANPVVLPIPFVMYASGTNRGYLLDQSSSSVMTGTMNEQTPPKQNAGIFASASAAGTYAVATYSNSVANESACSSPDSMLSGCFVAMNLLLTSPGGGVYNVTGTENPGNQAFTATYTVGGSGTGTFAPVSGAKTPNYVIYAVTETNFFMIDVDVDADPNVKVISPILYMAQ